jgi:hypothetical protein
MACPHVTGVIALNMEKYSSRSLSDIYRALICDAVPLVLHMNAIDTLSRNLLVHVPMRGKRGLEDCPAPYQCQQDCSNTGVCLPSRHIDTNGELVTVDSSPVCYCDAGRYGSTCELTVDTSCTERGAHRITLIMTDIFGDGWSFAKYAIVDMNGNIVNHATDSLCDGEEGSRTHCLPEGKYRFIADAGSFPGENEWTMCSRTGGTPYNGLFLVENRGHSSVPCRFICEADSSLIVLFMTDEGNDGWSGRPIICYN